MDTETTQPDLEKRFTQPEGWRWHRFTRNDREIRFGSVFPQDSIPDAVIVCLQGVREFSEKYYEIARWCQDNNFAFWMIDWVGQGKSSRHLKNPQKRHSYGFDEDIEDLHYFILEYIKHASVHPDKGRIPMAMLAHSMGANIGLHYIRKYPETFECAAFTAPMIGIKAFRKIPNILILSATLMCKLLASGSYIPFGRDWEKRKDNDYILSSDPIRCSIYDKWCESDQELRCGDITFGWVYEAQKSCIELQKPEIHKNIETPCLFALAGHEHLVDNKVAKSIIAGIKNTKTVEYPNSYHEILMEKNEIRDDFLKYFYTQVKENIIDRPESLKPF